jgi:CheY-like chemotaxis protein
VAPGGATTLLAGKLASAVATRLVWVPEAMAGVLVVEDDDDLRDNLEFLLRRKGYSVSGAANGRVALDVLAAGEPPCVILLDLMMPVMDGWELRTRLLADPRLGSVPVVLLSGVADLAERADDLRAVEHLTKPIDLARLYDLVAAHC